MEQIGVSLSLSHSPPPPRQLPLTKKEKRVKAQSKESNTSLIKINISSQDGSVGRRGSPLRTTTTKSQLKYRTTLTETELNGSLTTMELKEPHPSRLGGGAQTQNRLVPDP